MVDSESGQRRCREVGACRFRRAGRVIDPVDRVVEKRGEADDGELVRTQISAESGHLGEHLDDVFGGVIPPVGFVVATIQICRHLAAGRFVDDGNAIERLSHLRRADAHLIGHIESLLRHFSTGSPGWAFQPCSHDPVSATAGIGPTIDQTEEIVMALIEHESKERMTREQAAEKLREIADELARHNEISFRKDGRTIRVDVPDEVTVEVEISAGSESEIEIEISW